MAQRNSPRLPRKLAVIVLIIPALVAFSAQALERVTIGENLDRHPLGDRFAYLEDPQGSWSIADVRSSEFAGLWRRSLMRIPNFGLTESVYWFAVEVENKRSASVERILEVAYPMLDSVDLFLDRNGLLADHFQLGDRHPFTKRPVDHRHFLFPIQMSGHEVVTVYLRAQTKGSLQVPATLWSEPAFRQADQYTLLGQGSFFGVMLVMILYNLFIYSAVLDRSYLFYVLFVSCYTLAQSILQGFAFQIFWSRLPWLNEKIWIISMNAALMFAGCFAISFLGLKQQSRFFYQAIAWVALIAAANAIASLVIPYRIAMNVSVGISLANCSLFLAAGCMMWSRGYPPARYYTIAWSGFLVGTMLFTLAKLGFVARTVFTENAMQGGSAIEVILLSFALANRINVARREKEFAQAETVSALEKYRTLFENAIEGIFQTTLDYAFRDANRATARILGANGKHSLLSIKPVNLRRCFSTIQAADDYFKRLDNQHEIIGHEFRGKKIDGCEFWGSLSMRTIYGDEGQPSHYEGSLVDITERRQAEEQVRVLAYFDQITGLPNRALLQQQVKQALVRAKRNETRAAVFFVDLDRFKLVNDTFGHNIGDRLLQQVGARLTACLREDDWIARPQSSQTGHMADFGKDAVARLGGDEFVMVLSEMRQGEDAAIIAQRVVAVLSQPFLLEGKEIYISASIGISIYPIDGDNPTTLIKNADAAMYQVKKQGKDGYKFYAQSINDYASKRLSLENELRNALNREQFQLYYQPKVDLESGRISGVEALCRWQQAGQKLIPPAEFIPLAEESGLILRLGEWVLREACEQNMAWQRAGFSPTRISVNLSVRQFQDPNLIRTISRILRQSGLDSAWLELEITESILMDDTEATGEVLAELKSMGIHISIDDFGTGYSSLSYLKRFPVDVLKIDQCFIHDISQDADNRAITAAIISMAQQLSLKVIAEGVETQEQLSYLNACGCHEVQGYFLSNPLPSGEFAEYLRRDAILPVQAATT